ncbi:MAG: DNA replication/repair protein RecF [Clostridia bacterium]|nr:DNA replication/repair protein RecF [Clostridia bacterium]
MQVNRLFCSAFRNLKKTEIIPDEEMNVICGENAQGKTNILEALWLFTGAKSFRATKENSFIKFGQQKAIIELDFKAFGISSNIRQEFSEKRSVYLNGKQLPSPSKLAGNFGAVIFSPDDLAIVKDGPNIRRKFLDTAIGQLYPNYIEILRSYMRAVTQRNKIIKDYKYDTSLSIMLDVFEKEISNCAEKIIKYRKNYLENLDVFVSKIYEELSCGKEEFMSVYVANTCDIIRQRLHDSRKEDMYTGVTSVGPHRDDIDFKINGISARSFGSQGQQRSVALSLKLAQAEVSKSKTGEYPIILLDDVMSELDVMRQNFILNHIKGKQSFITCCDPNSVERLKKGKIINVKTGEVF